jgi:hypothetical protein
MKIRYCLPHKKHKILNTINVFLLELENFHRVRIANFFRSSYYKDTSHINLNKFGIFSIIFIYYDFQILDRFKISMLFIVSLEI